MTQPPVFTVVLTTFNRAGLLPRAITSVLSQTFEKFELIIVDDASTDNTAGVVRQFTDPRIRNCRHTKNLGVAAARNSGIRLAKGKFISFLDDDDEYLSGFIEDTFNELNSAPESVGFSWTAYSFVIDTLKGEMKASEKKWVPAPHHPEDRYKIFLQSMNFGAGCGFTVRRQCFERVGVFDESFKVGEDTEFLLRLCDAFDGIPIPKNLVKVHSHSGPNLQYGKIQHAEIYEKILYKQYSKLNRSPDLLSYFHYKIGWWYYYANNRHMGCKYLIKSLQADPWNIKRWLIFSYLDIFGSFGVSLQRRLTNCMHFFRPK